MSLTTQVNNLATRIATEFKSVRGVIGSLSSLSTAEKSSLVAAINEVKASIGQAGAQIDDTAPSTTKVYSSSKTNSQIASAVASLVGSAPDALNALDELANALGNDANFAATTAAALGNRLRVDTASQGLSTTQQANARTNLGVYSKAEIGDPETDFVATFTAGLA